MDGKESKEVQNRLVYLLSYQTVHPVSSSVPRVELHFENGLCLSVTVYTGEMVKVNRGHFSTNWCVYMLRLAQNRAATIN